MDSSSSIHDSTMIFLKVYEELENTEFWTILRQFLLSLLTNIEFHDDTLGSENVKPIDTLSE